MNTKVADPISTYVYVIGAPGHRPAKIGKADDVQSRLRSLQTGSPYPLELRLAVQAPAVLERELQERFKEYRIHGEWFDFGDKDAVAEVLAALSEIRNPPPRKDARTIWERIDGYFDAAPYVMPRSRFRDDGLHLDRSRLGGEPCLRCGGEIERLENLAFGFADDEGGQACDECATKGRPERVEMLRVLRDVEATFVGLSRQDVATDDYEFIRAMYWGAELLWYEARNDWRPER